MASDELTGVGAASGLPRSDWSEAREAAPPQAGRNLACSSQPPFQPLHPRRFSARPHGCSWNPSEGPSGVIAQGCWSPAAPAANHIHGTPAECVTECVIEFPLCNRIAHSPIPGLLGHSEDAGSKPAKQLLDFDNHDRGLPVALPTMAPAWRGVLDHNKQLAVPAAEHRSGGQDATPHPADR
ncbi:hypothetical protein BO71DRAFT_432078 [Aspergillus ellipticus CBS 707.79]|uniref:Uncharacterized protein n=1 Tax=Aspergillus ellipticus CBS 707.79 TaxID=1448320 RepID=A0A319D468_9EURO|nr:hypothetical protein BO71DRAFT_432078 [Aspergillus ellipticus CBS 707.79]